MKRFAGKTNLSVLVLTISFAVIPHQVLADPVDLSNLSSDQQDLLDEHVFGGLPSTDNIYIRNGYVLSYNPTAKVPNWVAYHVTKDYLETPEREGEFENSITILTMLMSPLMMITMVSFRLVGTLEVTSFHMQ